MFYDTFIMQQHDLYAYRLEFSCFIEEMATEYKSNVLGNGKKDINIRIFGINYGLI